MDKDGKWGKWGGGSLAGRYAGNSLKSRGGTWAEPLANISLMEFDLPTPSLSSIPGTFTLSLALPELVIFLNSWYHLRGSDLCKFLTLLAWYETLYLAISLFTWFLSLRLWTVLICWHRRKSKVYHSHVFSVFSPDFVLFWYHDSTKHRGISFSLCIITLKDFTVFTPVDEALDPTTKLTNSRLTKRSRNLHWYFADILL